jgi:hypothetical protein
MGTHAQTPAQRKALALMPRAVREHWSASRLAREAGIDTRVAGTLLAKVTEKMSAAVDREVGNTVSRLARIAQEARDADLKLTARHAALVERAMRQIEQSPDLDVKELGTLTALRDKHAALIERLTGLDVAKKVAVAREAAKDGAALLSWDGVEALDALPAECRLIEDAPAVDDPAADLSEIW